MVGFRTSVRKKGVPKGACGGLCPPTYTPSRARQCGNAAAEGGGEGRYCHERRSRGFGSGRLALRSNATFRSERRPEAIKLSGTSKHNGHSSQRTSESDWETTSHEVSIELQPNSAQGAGCNRESEPEKAHPIHGCKSNSHPNRSGFAPQSGSATGLDARMAKVFSSP